LSYLKTTGESNCRFTDNIADEADLICYWLFGFWDQVPNIHHCELSPFGCNRTTILSSWR